MKRARLFLFLGIWIMVLPFLGFPRFWKNILFVITGLGIVYVSYVFYRETKRKIGKLNNRNFENFSENEGFKIDE